MRFSIVNGCVMIVCVLALLLLTLDILAYSLNNLMLVSLHVPIINTF